MSATAELRRCINSAISALSRGDIPAALQYLNQFAAGDTEPIQKNWTINSDDALNELKRIFERECRRLNTYAVFVIAQPRLVGGEILSQLQWSGHKPTLNAIFESFGKEPPEQKEGD